MLDTELDSLEIVSFTDFAFHVFMFFACFQTVGMSLDADGCVRHVEKCSLVV